MSEGYFVTKRPDMLTKETFFNSGYIVPVIEAFRKMDADEPAYCYAIARDEEHGSCYHLYDTCGDFSCNASWRDIGRVYFVVRHNPGFGYPETVISPDGIFDYPQDAESYIDKHGGSWKAYTWEDLTAKMTESITLLEQFKEKEHQKTIEELWG